jgi:hypothetical protein
MQNTYMNSGGLFINDRKEKENHPDYTGKITVDKAGMYYIKGWKRSTKNGQPMLSLAADYAPEDKQPAEFQGEGSGNSGIGGGATPKEPTPPVNAESPF